MVRYYGPKAAEPMYNNMPKRGDPRRQTPDYRYHLTHDLLTNLHRGECCAVVGVGSCGKSRLLRHLARPETMEYHLSQGAYNHVIALVECNGWMGNTVWAAYEGIARSLSDFVENSSHPAVHGVRRELEPMYKAIVDERDLALKHLMKGLDILLGDPRFKLTLCLDEFDFVFEKFDAQLFRNFRAMRNAHKYQLTYLVATRKQLPFQRPAAEWPDVEEFYELFSNTTFAIGPYDDKDATEMVVDMENRFEYQLRTRTREWLIAAAGGHPGLIGAAFRFLESSRQQPNTQQEMDYLLAHESTMTPECHKIWEPLRTDEHLCLKHLALQGRPGREDVAVLPLLKSKGLIRETNNRGGVEIFSPIFREFVRNVEG